MKPIENEGSSALRRERHSRGQIDQLLAEYRESGQTQELFARERGLNVGTLRGWLYRKQRNEAADLREVLVQAGSGRQAQASVVVRTARGVEVELPLCAGSGWIERMVHKLACS